MAVVVVHGLTASGVTGTIKADESVVIAYDDVNGFGDTGPTIQVYDDFRNGTSGVDYPLNVAVVGAWDAYVSGTAANHPHATTDQSLSGSLSLEVGNSDLTDFARALRVEFTATTEFFITFWHLNSNAWQDITGGKLKMTWAADTDSAFGNDDLYDLIFPNRNGNSSWHVQGNDGFRNNSTWTSKMVAADTWHRAAWWERDNTPTMDFYIQRLTPGSLHDSLAVPNITDTMFSDLFPLSTTLDRIHFPGFLDSRFGNWNLPAYLYYDCIYVASGTGAAARVEIGNNSTYTSCTDLAICTPTAWANEEITVTLRDGAFPTLDGKFIFVTDLNNAQVGTSRLIS